MVAHPGPPQIRTCPARNSSRHTSSTHLRSAYNRVCGDGTYQGANSNHPGGANFLFADGSAKFIKSTINTLTYWALGTKANGEVLSSDSY